MSKDADRRFRAERKRHQWHTLAVGEEFRLHAARGTLYERLRRQSEPVWVFNDLSGHLGLALNGMGVDARTVFPSEEAQKFAQGHSARKYAPKMLPPSTPLPERMHAAVVFEAELHDRPAQLLGELLERVEDGGQLYVVLPAAGEKAFSRRGAEQLGRDMAEYCPGVWPVDAQHFNDEILLGVRKVKIDRRVAAVYGLASEAQMANDVVRDGRTKSGFFNWGRLLEADQVYLNGHPQYSEYDLVLTQIAGTSWDAPRRIREQLGRRSDTQLVVWCDYALEYWFKYPPYLDQFLFQLSQADYVCSVEPMQQKALESLLGRPVHLMPHPTDVDAIKRASRPVEERMGAIVVTHRDRHDHLPALMLHGTGLRTYLLGLNGPLGAPDGSEIFYEGMIYDLVERGYLGGEQAIDAMSRHLIAIDGYTHHVAGRACQELAALGVPTIGYPCVEAQARCFPGLTIEQSDVAAGRALVDRLMQDRAFYDNCATTAQAAVEYYDYPRARARFDEMLGHDTGQGVRAESSPAGQGAGGQVEPTNGALGDLAPILEPRPA